MQQGDIVRTTRAITDRSHGLAAGALVRFEELIPVTGQARIVSLIDNCSWYVDPSAIEPRGLNEPAMTREELVNRIASRLYMAGAAGSKATARAAAGQVVADLVSLGVVNLVDPETIGGKA